MEERGSFSFSRLEEAGIQDQARFVSRYKAFHSRAAGFDLP